MTTVKYSDLMCEWLSELGYTHCFFVAGGNVMHFLESASRRFTCVPFVHEVGAAIAAEYFTATSPDPERSRAFCLVTAGPGVTNALTAIAGAFLESRELLVVGGQVKKEDLADGGLRQRGIQEVDGIGLTKAVTKVSRRIESPIAKQEFQSLIREGQRPRKGPVFLEVCLDAQGAQVVNAPGQADAAQPADLSDDSRSASEWSRLEGLLSDSKRPLVLLGGGVSRATVEGLRERFHEVGIPVATTWNATDRIDYDDELNFGRPDTWGMRWSNVLIQQCDLLVAVGARLSLQQTGFNWQAFAPRAKVVHVDIDRSELQKPHPHKDLLLQQSAEDFLDNFLSLAQRAGNDYREWRAFGSEVRKALPLNDPQNHTSDGYISPYVFVEVLSRHLKNVDVVVPCSSGGASTVMMQAFRQKRGQVIINNKALASMGYGLSGAIGAALANPRRRIILTEGDGGFAQNLQELGTLERCGLSVKIFLFCNEGYASIRMTQRNYFNGHYVGCDTSTGLGLPSWVDLFAAYHIPCLTVPVDESDWGAVLEALDSPGPTAFLVPLDPEQTYFPKISSSVSAQGKMESNPLHNMTPELSEPTRGRVLRYLEDE